MFQFYFSFNIGLIDMTSLLHLSVISIARSSWAPSLISDCKFSLLLILGKKKKKEKGMPECKSPLGKYLNS